MSLGASHEVAVRAVRALPCNVASASSRAAWFEPAADAGTVSVTSAPEVAAYSSYASFSFDTTAAPGTTRFEYVLDGSSWAPAASSLRLGPLSPGPHTLTVRGNDGVNVSANRTVPWMILSQSTYQLQVRCLAACCHCAFVARVVKPGPYPGAFLAGCPPVCLFGSPCMNPHARCSVHLLHSWDNVMCALAAVGAD